MPRRSRETEALSLPLEFRRAYEDLRADYAAGGNSRYLPTPRGVQVSGSNHDYHIRSETLYFRMMERARRDDRDNLVVGQGINRLVANVVQGDGFTLDPQTQDKGFNDDLKARWYDWAEDADQVDYEGEKTWCDLEQLLFRHEIVDGDIVPLLLEEGCIQSIEAHRLKTPRGTKKNVVHGVELDSRGRRSRYWITKQDLGTEQPVKLVGDVTQYPVRDDEGERQVLHCYHPRRMSQTRGVTALAPVAWPLNLHDDIQFAALVAAQVQSCWAIVEEQMTGLPQLPDPITTAAAQTGSRTSETHDDGTTRTVEGMSPGMRVKVRDGYTQRGFSPTIPGPRFTEHAMLVLTFVAINLDLPLAVLLLDPTKTNFSGWRGAIDQARMRFRVMQRQYARQLHTPVYRWKLRQWAAEDKAIKRRMDSLPAREFFAHAWNPPTWAYIEPHKDISANALELATLQISPRRQAARRGEEFAEIVPEFVNDAGSILAAAEAKAVELNKLLSPEKPFTRDEVLRLFTAGGVSVSAVQGDESTGSPSDSREEEPVA